MKKTLSKIIALLLVASTLLCLVSCGEADKLAFKGNGNIKLPDTSEVLNLANKEDELTRDELEQIVNTLDEDIDTDKLTDSQLSNLADSLLNGLDKKDDAAVNPSENKGAYDENGAMTKPFDEVYPEIIENGSVEFSDEALLIKMSNTNGGKITVDMAKAGVVKLESIVPLQKETWYKASLKAETDATEALNAVRKLDSVLLAEYDYQIKTTAIDNYQGIDSKFGLENNTHKKDQWYMHHCGIPDGFNYMKYDGGQPSVIVAVIDTGVDIDHEDLKHNIWKNTKEKPDNGIDDDGNGYIDDYYGVNIVAKKGNGDDDNGHGTHVAGIIAARNNNIGTVGIAHKTTIMPIKAAMASGYLNQSDIAKAILYAYENGAEVINMSFGGSACSIAVQDALATAYTRCVLVASAGNDALPNEHPTLLSLPNYPAALTYVLGVMAVDRTGTETYFTNWDVKLYNGVEYELYAPGYDIMSTLPDNRYGSLSGTSMAAPVVSAMAAILRSEFADRDAYPTKFIYGQLTATSENYATCYSPDLHGEHNLPQIANLYAALTKLPKPDVGMQDFAVFDTTGFEGNKKNNGDGVIDAGETISLGLTLRNRWGMSKNTYVTLDAKSSAGIADPYVTFVNPTINYDSVGTYSTQDCGKVFTDELHSGWENPFIIKIAEDCPNDYIVKVNVHLRYENGIDEADTTIYTNELEPISFILTVRNGVVLPSIIEEDMVLTPDNLYIIPNSTVITEGTTVRVRPGTHIQFWTDDPKDAYADTYIAYLKVDGKFLVEGTKENPVYIYPSDLMDEFVVEISEDETGYISLKYADITNLCCYSSGQVNNYNTISYADHCTFRFNYGTTMNYRSLSGGVVQTNSAYGGVTLATFGYVENSVFYKIGLSGGIYDGEVRIDGKANRCIFADCGISYRNSFKATNCVFLGNTFVDQTKPGDYKNSSMTMKALEAIESKDVKVCYREETGTTYVYVSFSGTKPDTSFFKKMGFEFVSINDETELEFVRKKLMYTAGSYDFGIIYNHELQKYTWSDGSEIPSFIDPDGLLTTLAGKLLIIYNDSSGVRLNNGYGHNVANYMLEIPGKFLPTDITFDAYEIDIDMDATYQLAPQNSPIQLGAEDFIYESKNEAVIKVSDNGLVTPVGKGTADVYVYSEDKAVYNYVTFNVVDYVALEDFNFAAEKTVVAVGETLKTKVEFTPANTTRKNVTYSSSDPSIVSVDASGEITGVTSGIATITATCEGISKQIIVKCLIKTTSLNIVQTAITMSITEAFLPEVMVDENAEPDLSWISTDEEVLKIVFGKPIPMKEGTTTLIVKDIVSGLSDSVLVFVTENKISPIVNVEASYDYSYALNADGVLYRWYENNSPEKYATNIAKLKINDDGSRAMVLTKTGELKILYAGDEWIIPTNQVTEEKIMDFDFYMGMSEPSKPFYWWMVTETGEVYICKGTASRDEAEGTVTESRKISSNKIIKIDSAGYDIVLLSEDKQLYYMYYVGEPKLIARDVDDVCLNSNIIAYISNGYGYNYHYKNDKYYECGYYGTFDNIHISTSWYSYSDAYLSFQNKAIVKDGCITLDLSNTLEGYYDLSSIKNPVSFSSSYLYDLNKGTLFVGTTDGLLYAVGNPSIMGGATTSHAYEPVLVPLLQFEESLKVISNNISNATLGSDVIKLGFNKSLVKANAKLYENGIEITSLVELNANLMSITSPMGFVNDVQYQLVISGTETYGAANTHPLGDIIINFTYTTPEEKEPVIHESVTDTSIKRINTPEGFVAKINEIQAKTQYNGAFYNNAILNRLSTDTTVEHWLRPLASSDAGREIPLGGNWWGTTNETAIGYQITDYADFINYSRLMYAPYLTEAPEDTFPFVTSVKIFNKDKEEVSVVGNEQITVRITFNRDMDTSIPLLVRFGSAYPYGDYELEGKYVDARTWEGKYKLTTIIENGIQYFTIENGCSATDDLALMRDRARFAFEIDTTAAQALLMQGEATNTGVKLTWTQDDFDTLMGYNVYRATSEDGLYVRLNSSVIPADTMEFFDNTVEPGVLYYYNFTVVQTDLTESTPSGKIVIMSKDTMAPDIYHTPVYNAVTGSNLIISATVTDNINITYARVYYRVKGADNWNIAVMNNLNDKYSAIIIADHVAVEGLEYYIEAFDGVRYTYKGSADVPYVITVQEVVSADALGDVNGDGAITNLDALMLLKAINDQLNLTAEQFSRADLDGDKVLSAKEALRILQYVSGAVGSVDMRG